jgi:hypothetical protein
MIFPCGCTEDYHKTSCPTRKLQTNGRPQPLRPSSDGQTSFIKSPTRQRAAGIVIIAFWMIGIFGFGVGIFAREILTVLRN